MDLYFPIVRGAVAFLATGFLLYRAYGVARACESIQNPFVTGEQNRQTFFAILKQTFRVLCRYSPQENLQYVNRMTECGIACSSMVPSLKNP